MLNTGSPSTSPTPSPNACTATPARFPTIKSRRAFALAFGRAPTGEEAADACRLVERHGLTAFCRALLNTNEMISLD